MRSKQNSTSFYIFFFIFLSLVLISLQTFNEVCCPVFNESFVRTYSHTCNTHAPTVQFFGREFCIRVSIACRSVDDCRCDISWCVCMCSRIFDLSCRSRDTDIVAPCRTRVCNATSCSDACWTNCRISDTRVFHSRFPPIRASCDCCSSPLSLAL